MKQLFLTFFLFVNVAQAFSQPGYNIAVTVKPYQNQYVYLGYYYGKLKALADSA